MDEDIVKLGAEALDLINKAVYFDSSGTSIVAACDYYDLAILNIDEGSTPTYAQLSALLLTNLL